MRTCRGFGEVINRSLFYIFLVFIFMNFSVLCSASRFAGGAGTAGDPWQIETPEHLDNLRNYLGSVHSNKHFIQIADIDLDLPPWNQDQGWVPIGDWGLPFMGNYNGNGYVIRNLYLNRDDFYLHGLFGFLQSSHISNLGIIDANITSNGIAGILAAESWQAVINNCFTSGTVIGGSYAGGFIAAKYNGSVNNSYSVANALADDSAGGLIASYSSGIVENCFSSGHVSANLYTGGLIGSGNPNNVFNSYWNVESSGQSHSSGGIGLTTAEMIQQSTFDMWDFTDVWTILEGNSYPAFQFQSIADYAFPGPAFLTGTGQNQAVNLFWNTAIQQTCLGYNIYRNSELLNHADLITDTLYTDDMLTNWEFYTYYVTSVIEVDNVVMETLPTANLKISPVFFSGGDGSPDNPYLVETAAQLFGVRFALSSCFSQIADIDLNTAPWNEGEGWQPIGYSMHESFNGLFDGQGFEISGLYIYRPPEEYQGLFGYLQNAEVKNVKITEANITADFITGVLAGASRDSQIENCYTEGYVTGYSRIGGLVGLSISSLISASHTLTHVNAGWFAGGLTGDNSDQSLIINCFSSGSVIGQYNTGGITGTNYESNISNSFSLALVSGGFSIGGLAGRHSFGTIENCYSAGLVSGEGVTVGGLIGQTQGTGTSTISSYWDIETSQQANSAGGSGLTTSQMLQELSFIDWDFVNTWNIIENVSYPFLTWQSTDTYPILAPTGLTAVAGSGEIALNWNASLNPPLGYNLYRDGEMLNVNLLTETSFIDTTFEYWISHTYHVTAVYLINEEQMASLVSESVEIIALDFAGGNGSVEDPYLVETADQLSGIRFNSNAHYLQISDITLNDSSGNIRLSWQPIGKPQNSFSGSYNGNGFVISGLFIDRPEEDYQGLFGYTEEAEIIHVKLLDVYVSGQDFSGGLSGYSINSIFEGCEVSGTILGNENTGGLIGKISNSTLESCHAYVFVSATDQNTGGLIGMTSENSIITNCSSEGTVTRDVSYSLGGLIGFAENTLIASSFSNCIVQGSLSLTGGLIGRAMHTSVENSYSTGNVMGKQEVGGLIGEANTSIISGCFSTGNVMATYFNAGGLIGRCSGSVVNNCYSTGDVIGSFQYVGGLTGNLYNSIVNTSYSTGSVTGRRGKAYGFAGTNTGSLVTHSYWNIETSGHTTSPAGEGKTTAQMVSGTTYANWDFQDVWGILDNLSYPFLQWQQASTIPIPGPANLSGIPAYESIQLSWDIPANQPLGYKLYKNGMLLNDTALLIEPQFFDNEVNNWEFQEYFVTALYEVEGMHIESLKTNILQISAVNFAGGQGTEQQPFLLNNDEHLYGIRFALDSHFLQNGDINLTNSVWYDEDGWITVGDTFENAFRGVYDGNGFSIDGLYINRPEVTRQALFAYIDDALIQNVSLINANVTGGGITAGLAAYITNSKIENCHITGSITGTSGITGGLAAINSSFSLISNSSSNVNITGNSTTGGLVGTNSSYSLIENCYSQGMVVSSSYSVGGLAGRNWISSTIKSSYSNADVTGFNSVGGLIGDNFSSIVTTSYSTGSVRGFNHNTGGLVGRNEDSLISNSYSTSSVIGNIIVGGLVGIHRRESNPSFIENSFSIGQVSGSSSVGGLVGATQGHDPVYTYNSYWNRDTSGQQGSAGGYGRTTEDMTYPYSPDTYTSWDFDNIWGEDIVYEHNSGYPWLRLEPLQVFAGGDGSEENPWLIETPNHLHNIRLFLGPSYRDMHFKQITDINLNQYPWNSGSGWEPIGYSRLSSFQGTYDGNGLKIQGLFLYRPGVSHQGLFGFVELGTVKNLGLVDVNIHGGDNTAGLAAETRNSTVRDCFVTGMVTGYSVTGGLIGRIRNSTVSNCYAATSMAGYSSVAGLIGISWQSVVINCYSNGSVTSQYSPRGLIGSSDSQTSVFHSYWDVLTSGQTESSGGEGRTTNSMTYPYSPNTYVNWDFEETWVADIDSNVNQGYPYFRWQIRNIPDIAVNPVPENNAVDISILTEELSWSYYSLPTYADPLGFRVYFNSTGEFSEEDDDFDWIPYFDDQSDYSSSALISNLEFETTYYWKVVPTTIEPEIVRSGRNDSRMASQRNNVTQNRGGDALNSPVWSFTTESDTSAEEVTNPYVTKLKGNYPNPFNPETAISFSLAEESRVLIEIYNIRGQRVRILTDDYFKQGNHSVLWNARNQEDKIVSSGIYFYRMSSKNYDNIKKMMMIK